MMAPWQLGALRRASLDGLVGRITSSWEARKGWVLVREST